MTSGELTNTQGQRADDRLTIEPAHEARTTMADFEAAVQAKVAQYERDMRAARASRAAEMPSSKFEPRFGFTGAWCQVDRAAFMPRSESSVCPICQGPLRSGIFTAELEVSS